MFVFSLVENIHIVISELHELMYTMKLSGDFCVLCNNFPLKSIIEMVHGLSYVVHIIGDHPAKQLMMVR